MREHMPHDLFEPSALVSTQEMQPQESQPQDPPRSVLILDDDDDMRDVLSDIVKRIGDIEVAGAADVAAMKELGARALDCSLAILDVNLGAGQPSGIDAFEWLTNNGFHGQIVFLTGHARSHPLVQQAREHRSVRVLQKPIGFGTIRALLAEPIA